MTAAPVEAPHVPWSRDAELAVIGCALLNPDAMDGILAVLDPVHFFAPVHGTIFRAMVALKERGEPLDFVTMADALGDRADEAMPILYEATAGVARSSNVTAYARVVREKAGLRGLLKTAERVTSAALDPKGRVADVVAMAERDMEAISERGRQGELVSLAEMMPEMASELNELYTRRECITGLPSGFRELDEMTTGMHGGDLIIVAARPSVGKTSFAVSMALYAATKEAKTAAIFSIEMSKRDIRLRLVCSHARVDLRRLRSGYLTQEEIGRLAKSMGFLSQSKIWIDDTSDTNAADIRAKARRLQRSGGLDLVVVDYLQLIHERGYENRNLEIAAISRGFKALAKELDVPVVLLSQLSRAGARERPNLTHLRDGGSIEQDADVVIFLVRPEMTDRDAEQGLAEVLVAKQRNGPTGEIRLAFIREYTRFENLEWKPPSD